MFHCYELIMYIWRCQYFCETKFKQAFQCVSYALLNVIEMVFIVGIYFFDCVMTEHFHLLRMENPGLSCNGFLSAIGLFTQKRNRVSIFLMFYHKSVQMRTKFLCCLQEQNVRIFYTVYALIQYILYLFSYHQGQRFTTQPNCHRTQYTSVCPPS